MHPDSVIQPVDYGDYEWHPITEEQPKWNGTYIVFAPSADPALPLKTIAFWHSGDKKWLGLAPYWLAGITHWSTFPKDPER